MERRLAAILFADITGYARLMHRDEAAALAADVPDIALVLSDIQLAGSGTGLDLLDRVQGTGLPCVLMTSLPETHALHRAALARVPVLKKPFTAEALSRLLLPRAAE